MSTTRGIDGYRSYAGLPSLAGLSTIAEASRPGLGVEACVARLKRDHYAFKRLHGIFTARITAEPIYELKNAFALHAYLCGEHVESLRVRVGEMREPPLGLEAVPDPALEVVFDEILAAPTTAELLAGLYEVAAPALDAALARHEADTNPLADAPSIRVCRFARLEVGDMLAFGREAIASLVDDGAREAMAPWLALLADALAPPGGSTAPRRLRARPRLGCIRPRPMSTTPSRARRAVHRPVQPGGQPRSLPVLAGLRGPSQDADDAVQAASGDRRAGDDGRHHPPDRRASPGDTTATCRASSGTRPATR